MLLDEALKPAPPLTNGANFWGHPVDVCWKSCVLNLDLNASTTEAFSTERQTDRQFNVTSRRAEMHAGP